MLNASPTSAPPIAAKALVLENGSAGRKPLTQTLALLGYEVLTPDKGGIRAALDTHAETSLIILEWEPQDASALNLIRLIRSSPEHRSVTVLLVTAAESVRDVGAAIEAGADEYIVWPFSAEAFRQTLDLLALEQRWRHV